MKGYLFVLFALIATSECLLAMPSATEVEEFAKKVLEVAEQLAKLQEEFLTSLNKTSNQKNRAIHIKRNHCFKSTGLS